MQQIFKQWGWPWIFAMLLAIGVFSIYAQGLNYGLVFDDLGVFQDVQKLAKPIEIGLHFRSLWFASYQAVHQFIGSDLYWQRVVNVSLHMANSFLLWALTAQLIAHALREEALFQNENKIAEQSVENPALVQTAIAVSVTIWAINPVAVYAVQYLTQRSTLMATGFLLLGLLMFIQALSAQTRMGRLSGFVATVAALIAAVLSKEHAAPGIALLLPLYVYICRPNSRRLVIVSSTLIACAALFAVWMVSRKGWTLGAASEDQVELFLKQLDILRPGVVEQVYPLSVINQAWLYFRYGLLWIVPFPEWLSVDLRPPFPLEWYAMPQMLGALALPLSVIAGGWLLVRFKGRKALLGLLVLLPAALFVTELAFVRLQEPFVLYRSYLWSISLPALWSLIFLILFKKPSHVVLTGFIIIVVFSLITSDRVQSLRDDQTAWRDAVEKLDTEGPPTALGRWRAPHNLARWDLTRQRFEDAFHHARLADQLQAPQGLAKQKMGSALAAMRRPREALEMLLAAKEEGYQGIEIWVSIGSAYDQLGLTEQAFEAYDKALQGDLHSRYRPGALLAAGSMANRVGRYDKAIKYFNELVELQPDLVVAYIGKAHALSRQGQLKGAEETLSSALMRMDSAALYHARALVYLQEGDIQKAQHDVARAVAREPNNATYITLQRQIEVRSQDVKRSGLQGDFRLR